MDRDDFAMPDMSAKGRSGLLTLRDMQTSPGGRFISCWFKYEVSTHNDQIAEEDREKHLGIAMHLNTVLVLVFRNPTSQQVNKSIAPTNVQHVTSPDREMSAQMVSSN